MKYLVPAILFSQGVFTQTIQAQDDITHEDPFNFEASYLGDNAFNLHNGLKEGYGYLGMANIRIGFDAEKAALWKGGYIFVNLANTHGATPSADLFGDMQVASNIEAGDHTYIQEFWLKQTLGQFEITAGLQDLNVEFANTEGGSLYLNSSFGILPTISNNITAPIFPLTTLAVTLKWNISESSAWLLALYDGTPTDFESNPYNINWEMNAGDGVLLATEYQKTWQVGAYPGTYKFGLYSYSHAIEKSFGIEYPDSLDIEHFGIFGHADQLIWQEMKKSLSLFAHFGYSPTKVALTDYYLGAGINYSGLLHKQGKDILGLAIAHEHFNSDLKSETAIELSYQYPLGDHFFIQPDLQYIIQPAGTGSNINNCLAGTLRFGIQF